MTRCALVLSLTALLLSPLLSAQERGRIENALPAFEAELVRIVKTAEPAVACIVVSRSEQYARLGAVPVNPDYPGRLGGFDPGNLSEKAPMDEKALKGLLRRLDLARPDVVPEANGSGVVIGTGLVLTPYHLVRDAVKVYVRLPGGHGSYADIYAADPRSDLAVLRLLAAPPNLTVLPIGKAEDLQKGQFLLAMANPFAPGFRDARPSASWGLLSNLRTPPPADRPRQEDKTRPLYLYYGTLLQADVGINLGVSGAALLNLKGELVGLSGARGTLHAADAPGGFAIPMNAGVRRIIDKLRAGQEVEYGFLGINFQQGENNGVRIEEVSAGTPAAEAGLPPGGYIVRVNGTRVENTDDLSLAISTALAGSRITVQVASPVNAPARTYTVTLGKLWLPSRVIAAQRPPAVGGLRVDYTTTLLRGGFGDRRGVARGVAIREVLPGSPAEKANLQVDRIIIQVNGQTVSSPAEFYQRATGAGGALELTFSDNTRATLPLR